MLLPQSGYDPTESAVPWASLHKAAHEVVFATPDGTPAFADDMLVNKGFGLLSPILMPRQEDLELYDKMIATPLFKSPIAYQHLISTSFDALLIPGGHAKGVKTLLESKAAQACVVSAFRDNKPVAAVCHGVLLLARSIDTQTGLSVLYQRNTTALTQSLELSAWNLTRLWLGDYYRTYPMTVEVEVKQALANPKHFKKGPSLPRRDSNQRLNLGFTVRDKNYLSARWPGDCHLFAKLFVDMLALHHNDLKT
jgi:putative intracellular protease/amidase